MEQVFYDLNEDMIVVISEGPTIRDTFLSAVESEVPLTENSALTLIGDL